MSISNFVVKHLDQGQQHSAKRMTAKLRRTAYQSGWPTSASRHLTVIPYKDRYVVKYPSAQSKAIEDAEYGTESTPPNPVVRKFMAGVRDTEAVTYFEQALRKARIF